MSDLSASQNSASGVVRMSDRTVGAGQLPGQMILISHAACGDSCGSGCAPESCAPNGCTPNCGAPGGCVTESCGACCTHAYGRQQICAEGCCQVGGCVTGNACGCNSGYGCNSGHGCDNGACCYGSGYNSRMNSLFAGSACSGTGSKCRDFWRGQSLSFQAKNARLADHLFGWMIPSGCCGQGCPPAGKYRITYADQPGYSDQRDGQMYAAQGYGMPMTVPLAPNVHQQYNYGWGIPSSRLTPISNYNPNTSAQPLYHQTWHSDLPTSSPGHVHSLEESVRRTKQFLSPAHF